MKIRFAFIFFFMLFMGVALQISAQMVDPNIDQEDGPFCYFSQPTDVISVMDNPEGTLITPEGYLFTGYAEYMFFTGNPPQPVNQRVKTLLQGYLPIIQYQFTKENVLYQFMMFATTLDGISDSPLMNFVQVKFKNVGNEIRHVYFSIATRYQNDANTDWGIGDNRFIRPVRPEYVGGYEQSGIEFDPNWEYTFSPEAFLRDSLVMYLYPSQPAPEKLIVLKTGYNEPPEIGAMRIPILPTTPVGIVKYNFPLPPGEETTLQFKVPYQPLSVDDPTVAKLHAAKFEDYLQRTIDFWEKIFTQGISISLPEEKVIQTFKANLVYDLIARDKVKNQYIQKVNEFQYDAFWLRDASYIVRMYDISGYHDIARQCLDFFQCWQSEDGNFVSQNGQYDGWGQTMWAFGQHFRITDDKKFARQVFPAVIKAVHWLQQARQSDPLHVMPVTTPGDNENITGHVTGHNFWALAGLKNAIIMADRLGKKKEASMFRQEYQEYYQQFVDHLKRITAETGGYIPPGLEGLGGCDWGNMMAVYPEIILNPLDPMVTATLETTRQKYQEGIMTYDYGRYLHHYLTMKNTETEVVRGEQQTAIKELYAILLHTSSTHAGFEFSILPWRTRDFGMNLAPHGWFAAKFRTLLRNMLVREQGGELHLLSCLSPEWIKPEEEIAVSHAPTEFGVTNFTLRNKKDYSVLLLNNSYRQKPEKIVVHLPWFMNIHKILVEGKELKILGSSIALQSTAKKVEFFWQKKAEIAPLNYQKIVEDYKQEYRRRYREFLKYGN